jgi:hypothetical protein
VIRTPCGRFRVRYASALLTITMVLGWKSIMVTLFTRAAFYVGTSMFPVGRLMGDQIALRQRDPRKSKLKSKQLKLHITYPGALSYCHGGPMSMSMSTKNRNMYLYLLRLSLLIYWNHPPQISL